MKTLIHVHDCKTRTIWVKAIVNGVCITKNQKANLILLDHDDCRAGVGERAEVGITGKTRIF